MLILRDRTELHQLLQDLDGARDVTQALRVQAHEFSNKMHVISGLLELGRTEQAVDFITRSGHGGSVVSGDLCPGITDPDAASLLMAKSTIGEEKNIQVIIDGSSTLHPDGTTDQVTILGNLIDNAMEAVGSNGTIHVSTAADDSGCVITVSDDGPGVPDGLRERIFESGVTTKAEGPSAARGFGLSLLLRVAQRRHGRIEVGTSPLGGAEFRVRLAAVPRPVAVGGVKQQ
ncbi:ATP-binding protein [Arthrobacter sp. CAN_C5]|uniref:sensor histidine kinase n=1 Tax=Arthrobacter sp. CAN_C5 TaxID=2760706 RepID=UPI0028B23899|nr:ATP-binding protein [Arthrobacter sp. CAN_C5]MBP2218414.1 sensor histidine kinase regulating citrate/malate metabolism [Arthrobacter sp. CAN_C5]